MTDESEAEVARSPELLSRVAARLLIVDMQRKLVPLIAHAPRVTANCLRLIRGAQTLSVPVSATEQYPQGLGTTIDELAAALGPSPIPSKRRFSCCGALDWAVAGPHAEDGDDPAPQRDQIVVAGIEAHVCVQQTVLDLLAAGFRAYVVADAVGSRGEFDRDVALQRMRDGGAIVTTTESVLFEWCETSSAAEFKEISRLVKKG